MEETGEKTIIETVMEKEEIDWAKYLDYTRFLQPAEINNFSQEQFKKAYEDIE